MQPAHSFRLATVGINGVHWALKRNCSVSPGQLFGVFVLLCLVSLGLSTGFWFMGATLVWPFAVLEMTAVGAAFLVFARHATDREDIRLCDGRLVVEFENAGKTRRCEFVCQGLRIDPGVGREQLVELRGGGQVVRVGRFLRSDLRPALAREMRLAARRC